MTNRVGCVFNPAHKNPINNVVVKFCMFSARGTPGIVFRHHGVSGVVYHEDVRRAE